MPSYDFVLRFPGPPRDAQPASGANNSRVVGVNRDVNHSQSVASDCGAMGAPCGEGIDVGRAGFGPVAQE